MYPGFRKGFELVEQDEHRHIAFGVRFLRDVLEQRPGARRGRRAPGRASCAAAPRVVPPYAESRAARRYGYDSPSLYGFAYRKLERRTEPILGWSCPPAPEADARSGPRAG